MTTEKIQAIIETAKKDLKIHYIRSSGHGGQNVNKRATCCQITDNYDYRPHLSKDQKMHYHAPVTIKYGNRRSQHINKKEALIIWEERIIQLLTTHYSMHPKEVEMTQSDLQHLHDVKKYAQKERMYRSIFRKKAISHDEIQK